MWISQTENEKQNKNTQKTTARTCVKSVGYQVVAIWSDMLHKMVEHFSCWLDIMLEWEAYVGEMTQN